MEIRPNFGGGSPGFIRGGVSFFLQGGVPDFPKQGRLYPSDPPRCTPMLPTLIRPKNYAFCFGWALHKKQGYM